MKPNRFLKITSNILMCLNHLSLLPVLLLWSEGYWYLGILILCMIPFNCMFYFWAWKEEHDLDDKKRQEWLKEFSKTHTYYKSDMAEGTEYWRENATGKLIEV
jgi:hypothetical protein